MTPEALYEATCFAADNNALEIRSKFRSGPTAIRQVKKARQAFFNQKLLVERGVWDRYLFDGDMDTFFRLRTGPIWGGALRIDLGKPTDIDTLLLRRVDDVFKPTEAQVSADLRTWHTVSVKIQPESPPTATVLRRSYTVSKEWTDITVNRLSIDLAGKGAIRYIRIPGRAANVAEIIGFRRGRELDRSKWRASNVFAPYQKALSPASVLTDATGPMPHFAWMVDTSVRRDVRFLTRPTRGNTATTVPMPV